jgi:hypothetical protein
MNKLEDLEVTYDDLITIRDVITRALNRTALHPAQLTAVGSVYDKISHYIESVLADTAEVE